MMGRDWHLAASSMLQGRDVTRKEGVGLFYEQSTAFQNNGQGTRRVWRIDDLRQSYEAKAQGQNPCANSDFARTRWET